MAKKHDDQAQAGTNYSDDTERTMREQGMDEADTSVTAGDRSVIEDSDDAEAATSAMADDAEAH